MNTCTATNAMPSGATATEWQHPDGQKQRLKHAQLQRVHRNEDDAPDNINRMRCPHCGFTWMEPKPE